MPHNKIHTRNHVRKMDLKKIAAIIYLIILAGACIYAIRYYPRITSKIPQVSLNPEKINPVQPVNIVNVKTGKRATKVTIYRSLVKPTERLVTIQVETGNITVTKQRSLLAPGQITTLTYKTPEQQAIIKINLTKFQITETLKP